MQERISPARRISGTLRLPGDKSISHRYAMLAAIAEGDTHIRNYSIGADCQSTLGAVSALGAAVERRDGEIVRGAVAEVMESPAPVWERMPGEFARAHEAARQLGFTRAIHALFHEANRSGRISGHTARVIRRYTLFARSLKV